MAGGKAGVEVEGAKELRKALKRMDGRLDDLKDTHKAAAEIVAAAARPLVPVRTGALLSSLRTDRRASGASVLAGRSRIPYAGVIHFGWPGHNIEPQPFLYEALDARREEVAEAYDRKIGELVRRLDREAP
jgi:hypothetical protein